MTKMSLVPVQEPLMPSELFVLDPGVRAYLATAYGGLHMHEQEQAAHQYNLDISRGYTHFNNVREEVKTRTRAKLANFLGCDPSWVSLPGIDVSTNINLIIAALRSRAQDGQNVVMPSSIYSSSYHAWGMLKEKGVEIRLIQEPGVEALIAAMDENTLVLAVDHSIHRTGEVISLVELSAKARELGVLFIVDSSQTIGTFPISMQIADVWVASVSKNLGGYHGAALMIINGDTCGELIPAFKGWYWLLEMKPSSVHKEEGYAPAERKDAERFQLGGGSWPAYYTLSPVLTYKEEMGITLKIIQQHLEGQVNILIDGLTLLGFTVLTPRDAGKHGGSVCIAMEDGKAKAMCAELAKLGIPVSTTEGQICLRISAGLHTCADDMYLVLSCARGIGKKVGVIK